MNKKRLSGPEHTAGGKRQHAVLHLSHLCVFISVWQHGWHIQCVCLFTRPLWSHTWGAADWVSLTSCLFFTNSFPSSRSVFLLLISLTSLPLCSLFCEPERGADWVSLLYRLACLPPSGLDSGGVRLLWASNIQSRSQTTKCFIPGSQNFFYIILKYVGSVYLFSCWSQVRSETVWSIYNGLQPVATWAPLQHLPIQSRLWRPQWV